MLGVAPTRCSTPFHDPATLGTMKQPTLANGGLEPLGDYLAVIANMLRLEDGARGDYLVARFENVGHLEASTA